MLTSIVQWNGRLSILMVFSIMDNRPTVKYQSLKSQGCCISKVIPLHLVRPEAYGRMLLARATSVFDIIDMPVVRRKEQ